MRFPSSGLKLIPIATAFLFAIFSLSFICSLMATSDSSFSPGRDKKGIAEGKRSTAGSSTEIILVRHGETDWNVTGKMQCCMTTALSVTLRFCFFWFMHQGQLDIDLNEVGRRQAAVVAERLSREPNIYAIYSSDLRRALETAEIIAARCDGLEICRDQDLRERHLGDLQGLMYHELAKLSPRAYKSSLAE